MTKKKTTTKKRGRPTKPAPKNDSVFTPEAGGGEPMETATPNDEFIKAAKEMIETPEPEAEPEPQKDGRGGYRPNAGRPKGSDSFNIGLARMDQARPNPMISGTIRFISKSWATWAGVPELEFSPDECDGINEPMTRLLAYYFPGLMDQAVTGAWIALGAAVTATIGPRLLYLQELRRGGAGSRGEMPDTLKDPGDNKNPDGSGPKHPPRGGVNFEPVHV